MYVRKILHTVYLALESLFLFNCELLRSGLLGLGIGYDALIEKLVVKFSNIAMPRSTVKSTKCKRNNNNQKKVYIT